MNKPIGWRTPNEVDPQAVNITVIHEDGVEWHEGAGHRHLAVYRPVPEGWKWHERDLSHIWVCGGCGFLVEPVYEAEDDDTLISKLRAVVEALADSDPIEHGEEMWHWCVLCGATLPCKPADHEPDCPWRMAKEALA